MQVLATLVTVCLLLISAAGASGESQVTPDRPDLSNSTQTVPLGAFQIEAGLEYARSSVAARSPELRLAVQATLRTGLTDRVEVRLEGEPLVWLRAGEEVTDHGDLTLGFKYRFHYSVEGQWWPSLGVQPFAKFPVADAPIGSERADFGVLGLASLDLPWQLSLDLNAGIAAVGQSRPGGYLLQALVSASLARALTDRVATFAELFFASRRERDGRNSLGLDTGVIYLVTRRIALDAAVVTTLTGRGPDYAFRAGSSLRFGR